MASSLQPTSNTNPSSQKVPGSVEVNGFWRYNLVPIIAPLPTSSVVPCGVGIICPPPKGWGEDKIYKNLCKMPHPNAINGNKCHCYINTNIIPRKCILQFSCMLPAREILRLSLSWLKKQTNKKV